MAAANANNVGTTAMKTAPGKLRAEPFDPDNLSEVFQQTIAEFSAGLGERDRQIVEERIIAEDQKTLQELADEFGISRERVRQLEKRLVDQLREFMKAKASLSTQAWMEAEETGA